MLVENNSVGTTLITGVPENCEFFLFEAAIHWSKEGRRVFYITPKPLKSLPAAYHDRTNPSAEPFKRMKFIYAYDYEDLIQELTKIEIYKGQQFVLLVNNLDHYVNFDGILGSRLIHCAKLCSILLNTVSMDSEENNDRTHLCATTFSDHYRHVYEHYFENLWQFEDDEIEEDGIAVRLREITGSREFKLQKLENGEMTLKEIISNIIV